MINIEVVCTRYTLLDHFTSKPTATSNNQSNQSVISDQAKNIFTNNKMVSVNLISFVFIFFCKITQNVATKSRDQRFAPYTPFNTGLGVGKTFSTTMNWQQIHLSFII